MTKNSFQDVIKIKVLKKEEEESFSKDIHDVSKKESHYMHQHHRNKNSAIWLVAFFSIIFLFFGISFLFVKAKITINPIVKEVELNGSIKASKDSNDQNILSFDLITLSGEESKEVKGAEEKEYSEKAKGKVIIYNNFSTASQKLLIDTRLEGSNGKIYKTEKAVVIPGMKGETPGSVEVNIYANETGQEYNSAPIDFKIFGFKNSPKYEKFYARSEGEIVGGMEGKSFQLSEEETALIKKELEVVLKEKLYKKVSEQIPEGFILYKDATFLEIEENAIKPSAEEGKSVYVLKATLYGFLFNEQKLTKKIVENLSENYESKDIYIPNIKSLIFSLNSKDNTDFKLVNEINFILLGSSKIVWKFNETEFIPKILGKNKKELHQILSEYPNVESADLVIKPTWKRSFPDKQKDIKIIINYPQ